MRLVMKSGEAHCNIQVTQIVKDEDIIFALAGETLVGVFSIGSIDFLYVSGVGGDERGE